MKKPLRQANKLQGSSIINNSASVQMRQEGKTYRQSVIRYEEKELKDFIESGAKEEKKEEE